MTRQERLKLIYRNYAANPAFDHLKAHDPPKLLVPGRGSMKPRVIFVGEAPGRVENMSRKPFCGPAGRVLTTLLTHVGLERSEVFVTNVVKYRPTIGTQRIRNRTPWPSEILASWSYLRQEIETFDPGTPVVLLGQVALKAVRGGSDSISQLHGTGWYDADRCYVALYHPAVAVYEPERMGQMILDMEALRPLL